MGLKKVFYIIILAFIAAAIWFFYSLYSSGLKQGIAIEQSKQNLLTIENQNGIIQDNKFGQALANKIVIKKIKKQPKNNHANIVDNNNYRAHWLQSIYAYQRNHERSLR